MTYSIGFDIGGTNIAAGLVELETFKIVSRYNVKFKHEQYPGELADTLYDMAKKLCSDYLPLNELSSIGLAVPGSIDRNAEQVIHAHNLGLHNAPLKSQVQKLIPNVRCMLVNDADAAAYGELKTGAFLGASTAVLFTLGTGVGGGVIINKKLFLGGMKNGIEIGHIVIDINGELCSCGTRGCMETICSATALIREGRAAMASRRGGLMADMCSGDASKLDARMVIDCAKQNDPAAMRIYKRFIDGLSSALVSAIHLFDPEVIAIGGGVSLAGNFLYEPLRREVASKCFFDEFAKIVPAKLGNDAGIIGAAAL